MRPAETSGDILYFLIACIGICMQIAMEALQILFRTAAAPAGLVVEKSDFMQRFKRLTSDAFQKGWHERNGGNLSYRMKPEEAEAVKRATSAEKVQAAKALEEAYRAEQITEMVRAEKVKAEQTADIVIPAEINKQKVEIDAEAEAERIRREAEKGGASGERNNSNLSGEKPTTTTASNTGKTTPAATYSPPKGTGSLMMPMSGRIVTNYGQEKIQGLTSKGIEIRGSVGQAVKAADSGNVIYSGSLNNLGNVVIIDHGNLITVYGNLSGVSVSKGQKVSKGQSIGTLGRDINREANLYFETRKGVNTVNPMNYL